MNKKKIMILITIFILSSLILTNFKGKEMLIGGDGGLGQFFSTSINFNKLIYIWNPSGDGGFVTLQGIPYSLAFLVTSIFEIVGIPVWLIERLLYWLLFSLMGISTYFLISTIFDIYEKRKNEFACLIGAIFYMFNSYMLIEFSGPGIILYWYYIFLPLMLALFIKGLYSKNKIYIFIIALVSIPLAVIAGNPPYLASSLMVILFYYLFVLVFDKRLDRNFSVIYFFSLVGLYTLLNLWWILPMLLEAKSTVSMLHIGSSINSWMTGQSFKTSFINLLRLQGAAGFGGSFAGMKNYWFSNIYLHNPVFIIYSFMFPIIAFFSLIIYRKKLPVIFFSLIAITWIFLAKGIHEPLSSFSFYLFTKIPGFFIFRSFYPKFVFVIALSYSILIAYTSKFIFERIKQGYNKKFFIALLFIILIIIYPFPMWSGHLMRQPENNTYNLSHSVSIPEYYFKISKWINDQPGDFRVLRLPPQSYVTYKWGYIGGHIYYFLLTKPLVHSAWSISGSSTFAYLRKESYNAIKSHDQGKFLKIINFLGIGYIIVPLDIETKYYRTMDPTKVVKFLSGINSLSLVKKEGEVVVFKNNNFKPHIYYTKYAFTSKEDISYMLPFLLNYTIISSSDNNIFNTSNILKMEFPLTTDVLWNFENSSEMREWSNFGNSQIKYEITNFSRIGNKSLKWVIHLKKGIRKNSEFRTVPNNISFENAIEISFWFYPNVSSNNYNGASIIYGPGQWNVIATKKLDSTTYPSGQWHNVIIKIPFGKSKYLNNINFEFSNRANSDNKRLTFYIDNVKITRINISTQPELPKLNGNNTLLPMLTFKRVNPTKYIVNVENATKPFFLVFSESYNPGWKIYSMNKNTNLGKVIARYPDVNVEEAKNSWYKFTPQDIVYLLRKPAINESYHFKANGYANAWYINPVKINKDGSGNFTLTIYFRPQSYFYLGLFISMITLILSIGYLFYDWRRVYYDN